MLNLVDSFVVEAVIMRYLVPNSVMDIFSQL